MILYFSGTGNSRYVAQRIADITGDEAESLNEKIKRKDFRKIDCRERLIFVTPVYAWRLPKIVKEWIQRTDFDNPQVWFVMTCGSEIGNAAKYNRELCEQKHFQYMGTAQILMPENYIAMFNAPKWDEAEKIIAKAEPDIQRVGKQIKAGKAFASPRNNLYDRTVSGLVNGPFYKLFVKADAFYAKDLCIGCGQCALGCPTNNITLKEGKPVWGNRCTHCMACICYCPREAIEYGKKSIGKPRYHCKK